MKIAQAEIRNNAIRFAHEWKDEKSERAEAQTFWTELFAVFGIHRRSVASFEERVKNLDGAYNRIDVFYRGVMLGEHKSAGQDLTKAQSQAFQYVQDLTRNGRDSEIPQYIVLSDFQRIVVFDLDTDDPAVPVADFPTEKLHENTRHLAFLTGQITKPIDPEDPINIEAVEILGDLHDALEADGYTGHALERFLVRILFMLFADDTGIFDPDWFKAIVNESRSDGFGLGALLNQIFEILDTPKDERSNLSEEFAALPYVNGKLFDEHLPAVNFNQTTRKALIDACEFNWSRISPAVFGSLFQSIMAGEEGARKRRQIGAHYTSERDIMKLIRSLFLDELEAELRKCGSKKKELEKFHDKIASLKLLDPACGCGNFLVVAYRELRRLEIEALLALFPNRGIEDDMGATGAQRVFDLTHILRVDVDQMHGIEIEEWPARIAEVAMWLIDHQMNTKAGEIFGVPVLRLPLKKSAKIVHANALRTNWNEVLPASECSFVLGNPPFIGHHLQTKEQKEDQNRIWHDVSARGVLDYVTCWYRKAADYIEDTEIQCAFVSTNSIAQGEQPSIFWPKLLHLGVTINLAHRTFKWTSEARGKAHVHVVIIGFGLVDTQKHIWDYDSDDGDAGRRTTVSRISPYLVEGPPVVVAPRSDPVSRVPRMRWGNKPTDGGNLILSLEERERALAKDPYLGNWIRPYLSGQDFLNGGMRYCIWLTDEDLGDARNHQLIRDRLAAVRDFRLASKAKSTRDYADFPYRFRQISQPDTDYLAIPEVSSERRPYIPMAYLDSEVVCSNTIQIVPEARPWHFGILTSEMHMAWMRTVCGRLKSDYRYSNSLVYNNFPWPQTPTDKQRSAVESAAQSVLDAREQYPDQTLADLYNPLAMPKPLRDAHRALDRAVDRCYRPQPFTTERARVEYLFDLYQKLTEPLTTSKKKKRTKRKAK